MSRLFENIANDELSLGAWIKGGPHLVRSLYKGGFDFVRPDMMYSSIDWKELDHILQTCEATGLTCWTRIPSNAWAVGPEQMQVTVDAQRAFGLGMPIVQVSVAGAAQVRALMNVQKEWQGAVKYPPSSATATATATGTAKPKHPMVIPAIENGNAIREIDEILEIDGLRGIFIACTDFSKEVGHPFQYDHPEVWKAMDRIINQARTRGIFVGANTGYDYKTPEEIRGRVMALYDHGVRAVLVQGAEFLLETYSKRLIDDIKNRTS